MSSDAGSAADDAAQSHSQASGPDGASTDSDEVFGLDRTQQYVVIAVVGLGAVLAGAVGVPPGYATLALGVGVVMVAYGAIGGAWNSAAGTLDLDPRTRIWVILGVAAVLLLGNTVIGDLLGESVGLVAFGIGLITLVYGGGLAISHYTG